MHSLPNSAKILIQEFSNLPGIGKKTAQRLTFYILQCEKHKVFDLSQALKNVKEKIRNCSVCNGIAENDICDICNDPNRDGGIICVVENSYDIIVFEKTNAYKGLYHVLGGTLSPLDGVGPEELNINKLVQRVKVGMEIILATNSNVEGETTALYLTKILTKKNVNLTRLARGIPIGSDLGYIDSATLIRSMEGRTSV